MTFDLITPPVLLGAAGLILLTGEWFVRRAVEVLLFALGAIAGQLAYEQLVAAGLIPATTWSALAVMTLCGLIAAALSRNDVILRNLVILAALIACFAAASAVAQAANIPVEAVWIVFVLGAAVSPPLLVGALVTALIVCALQPLPARTTVAVFVGVVAYARLRHCTWYWRAVDQRLREKLHPCVSVSSAKAATIPVLLRCRRRHATEATAKKLRAEGIQVESLPGGFLAAEVPQAKVKMWSHPLVGLVQSQPHSILSADTPISLPPILKSDTKGMELGEIAERLRTDHGEHLGRDKASGRGTVVAIVDTGVRPVNDALKRALIHSEDFTQEGTPDDRCGHGTMVANALLAIAPDAKIISLKCLDENGSGSLLSVMRALKYAAEQGSKMTVINLSLGASLCHGDGSDPLCRAVAHIQTAAIAAIGNSGPEAGTIQCPGCSQGAIGAGAVDGGGHVARFSSRGPCRDGTIRKPDIVNYGVAIRVQDHTGAWVTVSGTSFASPLTAGIAACCAGLNPRLAKHRRALYAVLLRSSSKDGLTPTDRDACGSGLPNLCRAARLAQAGTTMIPVQSSLVWRTKFRLAGAAAAAVVLAVSWTVLLDHSWCARPGPELRLLGRIGHSGILGDPVFTVDDGTGVFTLRWLQPESLPRPGSIAYVSARRPPNGAMHRMPEGRYRFTILPPKQAE